MRTLTSPRNHLWTLPHNTDVTHLLSIIICITKTSLTHDAVSTQMREMSCSFQIPIVLTHMFLLDKWLLAKTLATSINSISRSDHASILQTIQDSSSFQTTPIWRVISRQQEDTMAELEKHLVKFSHFNSVSDSFLLWNAHKAFIRGLFIKLGAMAKRKQSKQINTILTEINNLTTKIKLIHHPKNCLT